VDRFVLYAEDDADDRTWIQETCKAVNAHLTIFFLENGREVLDFLQSSTASEMPALIILDLNMPKLDGRQTLQRLKAHPCYSRIPVVIVSTSSSRLDREACQYLGAELFLSKPNSFAGWQSVVQQLIPLAV
jgi:CheY-like chemotaxis protein